MCFVQQFYPKPKNSTLEKAFAYLFSQFHKHNIKALSPALFCGSLKIRMFGELTPLFLSGKEMDDSAINPLPVANNLNNLD